MGGFLQSGGILIRYLVVDLIYLQNSRLAPVFRNHCFVHDLRRKPGGAPPRAQAGSGGRLQRVPAKLRLGASWSGTDREGGGTFDSTYRAIRVHVFRLGRPEYYVPPSFRAPSRLASTRRFEPTRAKSNGLPGGSPLPCAALVHGNLP